MHVRAFYVQNDRKTEINYSKNDILPNNNQLPISFHFFTQTHFVIATFTKYSIVMN